MKISSSLTLPVGVDFDFWEKAPLDWLDYDRDAPDRKFVAEFIKTQAEPGWTMTEIGFGTAIDYERYFSKLPIKYTGVDGCMNFVQNAEKRFPEAEWVCSRNPWSVVPANIVYTRATLEHQEDFKEPLVELLSGARDFAIVTWYIPPDIWCLMYNEPEKMYYNQYDVRCVESVVLDCGFGFLKHRVGSKEVWVCRNNKANIEK